MAYYKLLSLSLYASLLAIPAYFQFVFSTFNLFSVEIWVSDGWMACSKRLSSFSLTWNCLLWMSKRRTEMEVKCDNRLLKTWHCTWFMVHWYHEWYHHLWMPVATKHATKLTQRFPKKKQACTFRWHRDYYLNRREHLRHKREGETQPPLAKSIRRLIQHLSRRFVKYLPPCWGGLNPLKQQQKEMNWLYNVYTICLFVCLWSHGVPTVGTTCCIF